MTRRLLVPLALLVGGLAHAHQLRAGGLRPTSIAGALLLVLASLGWLTLVVDALGATVWPLVRRTVVAGGRVKASHALARLARPTWALDRPGGAALAGALALLHRREHDAALATWLEGQLAAQKKLGLAGVVATALLAASRGDRSGARELLRSADDFDATFAPAAAREIANEWLVADAAARGDWAAVIRRGVDPGRATAYTRFLARAAARIRGEAPPGEPSPTDLGLRWSWLLAPGRAHLRPLLDQALATPRVLHQRRPPAPPAPPPPPPIDPAAHAGDPLAYAQALHALWTHTEGLEQALSATRMQELCAAWDAAWPVAARRLAARVTALGATTTAEAALSGLRRRVAGELADLARKAKIPLASLDPSIAAAGEAATLLRAALLDDVERASEELRRRTQDDRRLSAPDELRAWTGFRRLYEEAALLGGLEVRYVLFPQVHRDACGYAVWLWNDRKEYGISSPIFRWLLAEAEAVGDQEAIELQRKNVGVGKR